MSADCLSKPSARPRARSGNFGENVPRTRVSSRGSAVALSGTRSRLPFLQSFKECLVRCKGPVAASGLEVCDALRDAAIHYGLRLEDNLTGFDARVEYVSYVHADLVPDALGDDHLKFILDRDQRHKDVQQFNCSPSLYQRVRDRQLRPMLARRRLLSLNRMLP